MNTYLPDLPPAWHTVLEFDLCPAALPAAGRHRPDHLGGDCRPPPPIPGADGLPDSEHEVAELLHYKMRYCRPHVLVCWAGIDASFTCELLALNNLTNC